MELHRQRRFRLWISLTTVALLLAATFSVLTAGPTQAAQTIPYKINFQGRLTDNNGNVLTDGSYNIKFRILDAPTSGTNLWQADRVFGASDHRITVTNGLFNIQFGDTAAGDPALSPSLFSGTFPLYLEVELPTPATATCSTNGCASFTEGAMTPRQPLASSPYAFNSDTLDGLDATAFAQLSAANTFSGTTTFSKTSGPGIILSGTPASGGSILQVGGTLSSGNANGTLIGANGSFTGDLLNLQVSNATKLKVDNSGNLTLASGAAITIGASAGTGTTCSGGQFLQNQTTVGGVVTGGTCATPSGTGAATDLSNLIATNINQSLVAGTNNSLSLGSAAKVWQHLYTADVDAGSTTTTLTIGTVNATAITIGKAGVTTTFNGPVTAGSNTITGGTITGTSLATSGNGSINSGTGSITGGTFSSTLSATTGTGVTISATDTASSGTTTLQGTAINLTGTNNAAGSNTITGLNFGNVTAATNNTFRAVNFGTGFTNLLTYNGSTTIINGTGQLNGAQLQTGTVANGALANSSLTVTAGTGLSGGGSVSLGGSTSLSVAYGSSAGTAVQGNTSLTCPSGSGGLSGGGNTITLGTGGTCSALSLSSTPSFSSLAVTGSTNPIVTLSSTGTSGNALTLDDQSFTANNSNLANFTFKNANASATATTVSGLSITPTGGTNANSNANTLNAILFPNVTPVTNNAFYALNFGTGYNDLLRYNGTSIINGSGLLNGAQVQSGTIANAALANSSLTVTAGTGLSGGGSVSLGGSISLSVAYGSGAGTAVQGNVSLTCPSGSGNLTGGGTAITLGTGGTCGAISIVNNPSFSTSVTSPAFTGTGAVTVSSGGSGDLTLDSASNTILIAANDTTLRRNTAGAGTTYSIDLNDTAATTLAVTNSASGIASLTVEGGISIGSGQTYKINNTQIDSTALSNDANLAKLGGTQTFTGTNTFQPTTNITSLVVKQTSGATPTADIFNLQTANATNIIQVTGPTANEAAVSIASVGATRALTLTSGSGTVVLGSSIIQRAAAGLTLDVNNGAASTLTVTNSNASFVASLSVEGGVGIGTGQVFSVGVTNGSTISACTSSQYLASAAALGGLVTGGSCTNNDLQTAYTNSSSPATIALADAKNFVINAGDTTTDPSILFNLQCSTCSASGGRFAVQDNGTDLLTVNPVGSIVVAPTTGQNVTMNLAGSSQFTVAATSAPTVDQVSITNAGQAVATAGISGLQINYIGGAGAIEASAARIDATPGSTSGSTWNGLRIADQAGAASGVNFNGLKIEGPGAPGGGTETAINITTGWDVGLNVQSGGLQLTNITDPGTPAAGTLRVYSKTVVGRSMLKAIAPSGVDYVYQPSLFQQNISLITAGSGTTVGPTAFGTQLAALTGTVTIPTVAEATGFLANQATAATANSQIGMMSNANQYYRGSVANGSNGFFFMTRVSFPDTAASYTNASSGTRFFAGLASCTTNGCMTNNTTPGDAPTGDFAGFRLSGSAGETTFRFITRDNTTTNNVNTGVTLAQNKTYDMYFYVAPQGTTIFWRIDNLTDGVAAVEGNTTNNLPRGTMSLRFIQQLTTIGANIRNLRWQRTYIESDR